MSLLGGALQLTRKAPDRLPQVATSSSLGGILQHSTGSSSSSFNTQLSAYTASGWVFAVVQRITTAVARNRWHLYRINRRTGEREEIFDHPALLLWRHPNPFQPKGTFLEVSGQHLELAGETEWLVVDGGGREPRELWPIRPDRIKPIPHPTEYLSGWEYQVGSYKQTLEPEDVIQIKMPSPLDPYRGTGPIAASLLTIDTDKLSAQWVRNFYQNNAMVSGYIEADESMGDAEFDQFVERFRTNHQGVSNAWHVAFLERAKFHETKYTQRDMQFQELRRLSRDEIFGVFGIHPAIMGISESVNRANAEAAEVHFARWLIKPRLERIRDVLNEQILPRYGDNLEFDFDDPVPEDQDAKLRRVEVGYSTKTLTANERRAELGYPDADEEDADDLPQAQPSPFSLEAPRGTLKAADEQEIRPDEVNDEEELLDDVWERRLRAELDGLIEYLTPFFARRIRSAPYRVTTKIEISDVDGYDWNWSAKYGDDVIAELTKAFAAVLSSVSAEGVPVFPPPEVQRLARLYAVHRAGELLSVAGDLNIVFQTRQRVRDLVAENIRTGQSLNDLQAALRSDLSFSRARAERIARTETATALGQGQKQAAIAQGRDQKRWVTQGDSRVNPEICAANASQGWIAVDDSFQSGHDVIPGHVNCRCTIRYRTGELYDAANVAIVGKLDSFRCPECNKLLKDHAQPGAVYWCRRCKADRKAPGVLEAQKPMVKRRQEIERDEYGAMVAVVTMEE